MFFNRNFDLLAVGQLNDFRGKRLGVFVQPFRHGAGRLRFKDRLELFAVAALPADGDLCARRSQVRGALQPFDGDE